MKNLDAQAILETMHQPLIVLDKDLIVQGANRAFYHRFDVDQSETEAVAIYKLGNGQWNIPKLRELLSDILPTSGSVDDFVVEHVFESIGRRIMKINARAIPRGNPEVILLAIDDITPQEDLLAQLKWQKELAEATIAASPVPFLVLGEDLRVQQANNSFCETFSVKRNETIGRLVFELGNNQWDIPKLRELLEDVIPKNITVDDFEVEHDFEEIGHRIMVLNARRIDHLRLILIAIDLTAHRMIERTEAEDANMRSFTLELVDRMRKEADEASIVGVTCAALGQRLGADQVLYGEIGESEGEFAPHLWSNGPRTETHHSGEIPYLDRLTEGETVAIDDVKKDAAASSFAYAPLVEGGQLRAVLGVQFLKPHEWRSVDVKLVEDVAERLRDAVARCRAETEIRESQERFLLATKATNDVIWDWDMFARTYWCNENMQLNFGHDTALEDFSPTFWESHIHSDDKKRVVDSFYAAVEGVASTWTEEYRFLHADGKAIRLLGRMIDVTAEREMASRLRQAQKLEAIGQLTGGVTHDFNNLLTVILGNAEMLGDDLEDRKDLRRLAKMIESTAERGAELIKRLLAFSRTQTLEPRLVDVGALMNGIEGLLRRTLTANIDIAFNRMGRRWRTEIDPSQLESAILNLTLNARDAMPDGGLLTIEIANAELDEAAAANIDDLVAGEYVLITVTDNGEGIPDEVMARIFEPFFTTKEVGDGSGLGLSMVYGFVKQSGGHIIIDSAPGEGTSVKLYFPRSPRPEAHIEVPATRNQVVGGDETILVVEDDTLVREHLINQLIGLGYRVVGSASGPEALELLKQIPQVELLFTDIVLPDGMNGRQLAETVQGIRPEIRVLFTSGFTDKAMVDRERLDMDVELLRKPYRREQMAAMVRKVLDQR